MKFHAGILLLFFVVVWAIVSETNQNINVKKYTRICYIREAVLRKGVCVECLETNNKDILRRCRQATLDWKLSARSKRSVATKQKSIERNRDTERLGLPDLVTVELISGANATQKPRVDVNATTNANLSYADLLDTFKKSWPLDLWRSCGLFDEQYLESVNKHWLQFPPPAAGINNMLGALYILLMAAGCLGNALVVFMYIRCRSLRTPGNILVVNLAVSDFLMLAKTPVFIFNSFYQGPVLGRPGCVVYGFLGGLTGVTSTATLSAIAFDRYTVVVRPLDPLKNLSHIRAKTLAVATWIYAGSFSVIPALDFGYGRYVPEGYLTSCSFDYLTDEVKPRYFIFVFFCAGWVIPFSIISFCYLKILRVVISTRDISKNAEHRLSSRHVKEQAKRKAEIKLAGLVIAVIILFFLSWTPYAIVSLLGIFGKRDFIIPMYSMIPALFCKSAGCINPFIYIMTHPKFKAEFQKIVCKDKSKRRSGTLKTQAYYSEAVKNQQNFESNKDVSSEDGVEVLEMRDILLQEENTYADDTNVPVKTVSARVLDKPPISRKDSNNSFDSNVVPPPSWFKKPQFSEKRRSIRSSFRNRSSSSISSVEARPSTTT